MSTIRSSQSRTVALALTCWVLAITPVASGDVFHMPSGQKSLEFVTVGDICNAADTVLLFPGQGQTIGYGRVDYTYQIAKYDVTAGQYAEFLNAVAATDPYGLYHLRMGDTSSYYGRFGVEVGCGITRSNTSGGYTYSVVAGREDFPVNYVSWGDAARFCNWLTNGQPVGAQGPDTTETGSYMLDGATSEPDLMAVTRSAWARYVIPNQDEWYKAAYYKGGCANAGYWTYPTCSDTQPSNVLSSTGTNNANYYDYDNDCYTDPTNYLTPVGAFACSPAPYGTFDMGGNVWQWTETVFSNGVRFVRSGRGGSFRSGPYELDAHAAACYDATDEFPTIGFRVVLVPAPMTPPGTIVGWGLNNWGQMNVPSGDNFVALGAGDEHCIALRRDGSLAGWGDNYHGQATVPAGNDFVAIAAGNDHSYALRLDGSIVVWGQDQWGLLDAPPGHNFVGLASGGQGQFCLALRQDGSLVAWGNNDDGETDVPSGNDFVAASTGGHHGLALRRDGSLVAWGARGTPGSWPNYGQTDVPPGNDFVAIAAGGCHNIALRADGSLVAWGAGDGDYGFGQNHAPAGNDYVGIAAGATHSLALKADGTIVAWGDSRHGELNVPAGENFIAVEAGTGSSFALIANPAAPCITAGPANRVALAGESVTFSVVASGTRPLGYVWRKDGAPLSNGGHISGSTTATLVLDPVQCADAGSYDVVVTNVHGTATSSPATLTVYAAPAIITGPASRTVHESTYLTLTVQASGTPPLAYQWRKNGADLSDGGRIIGVTWATLTINPVQFSDAGEYEVVIRNAYGTATSAAAVVTVLWPGDVDADGDVDVFDVIDTIIAFGCVPGDPKWNAMADFNRNGIVDVFDVIAVVGNFGKSR